MSKRALLQVLGWIAAGLTYLVAAGASGGVPAYAADCVGLASLPHWLDSVCERALVPRLFILGIGAIPTILLFYLAGKEERPQGSRGFAAWAATNLGTWDPPWRRRP